ncbi:hypothetical protein RB195_007673 [Necator americanus]|uniref:Plectin/S10 domain protein n=2 Tax=Necator americanus TaxID=51031 RepID=W2TA15_NECAM|nr:Plectin/S10 domain protein [Necator americanus]ETN78865.1 Plectin/S10 domain protein [Necator americanus]
MLIPSKNRKAIYEYLFNEGVAVAKKDFNLKQHPNIPGVTNLEVIKALKSLASRELVKEQFAWRHYYWYLTDEGIAHLREVLNLPAEIVPSTVKSKPREVRAAAIERIPRPAPGKEGDREAYRIAEKVTEAGPGSAMPYRAGFGRGAPPPQ